MYDYRRLSQTGYLGGRHEKEKPSIKTATTTWNWRYGIDKARYLGGS